MDQPFGTSYLEAEGESKMIKENSLVYSFKEHGLYYENNPYKETQKIVTFAIDTLQLDFDYNTGELKFITGFLPLVKSKKISINVPNYIEENYCISLENIDYFPGMAYEYFDFFTDSENYFLRDDLPMTYYDEATKLILIGTKDSIDKCIKINKNIYCGIDETGNLKYLLICSNCIII